MTSLKTKQITPSTRRPLWFRNVVASPTFVGALLSPIDCRSPTLTTRKSALLTNHLQFLYASQASIGSIVCWPTGAGLRHALISSPFILTTRTDPKRKGASNLTRAPRSIYSFTTCIRNRKHSTQRKRNNLRAPPRLSLLFQAKCLPLTQLLLASSQFVSLLHRKSSRGTDKASDEGPQATGLLSKCEGDCFAAKRLCWHSKVLA